MRLWPQGRPRVRPGSHLPQKNVGPGATLYTVKSQLFKIAGNQSLSEETNVLGREHLSPEVVFSLWLLAAMAEQAGGCYLGGMLSRQCAQHT